MIALRKGNAALSNCRKDLTTVQYDEENKWVVVVREDLSGAGALLVGNFRRREQKVRVNVPDGNWKLFGGEGEESVSGEGVVEMVIPAEGVYVYVRE